MNYFGLDLGASKLSMQLILNDKIFFNSIKLQNQLNPSDSFLQLMQKVKVFLKKLNCAKIHSTALSSAATINEAGEICKWPNKPHWIGLNIKKALVSIVKCVVHIEDDGNAAAIAESDAYQQPDLIYIGIGSGLGGGIVINHRLHRGRYGQAADFGHITLSNNKIQCNCGKIGCLQNVASATAIFKNAFPKLNHVNHLHLKKALANNTISVKEVMCDVSKNLSETMESLIKILDIDFFVIGGGLGHQIPELIDMIRSYFNCFSSYIPEIRLAKYKEHSSLMGALLLAKKQLI